MAEKRFQLDTVTNVWSADDLHRLFFLGFFCFTRMPRLIYQTPLPKNKSPMLLGPIAKEHSVCRSFVLLPRPHTQTHLALWCLCAFVNEEILIPGWDIALSWGNHAWCSLRASSSRGRIKQAETGTVLFAFFFLFYFFKSQNKIWINKYYITLH